MRRSLGLAWRFRFGLGGWGVEFRGVGWGGGGGCLGFGLLDVGTGIFRARAATYLRFGVWGKGLESSYISPFP